METQDKVIDRATMETQDKTLLDATLDGDVEAVKEALKKGASVNCSDTKGWTPLHMAAAGNNTTVIRELLEHKDAKLNAKTTNGQTPLHVAAWNNATDISELFIHSSANLNATDDEGQTPLHVSTWNNATTISEKLIFAEADVNVKDNQGLNPIHWEAGNNTTSTLELLIKWDAIVNTASNEGWTPLHWAAAYSKSDSVLELLIHGGADTNARNNLGQTPVDIAAQYNTKAVSEILKQLIANHNVECPPDCRARRMIRQGFIKLCSRETIASYDGCILVVGEFASGKTTLVMNLIDETIPYERRSTDGIDVYFAKLLFDVKRKKLIKTQSGQHSFPKAVFQKAAAYVRHLDSSDTVMGASTEHHKDSITTSADQSNNVLHRLCEKLELLGLSDGLLPIPILDFVGHQTHQTFITSNGIYVITLDGRRNLREPMFTNEVAPGKKSNRSILENIRMWISSILAYCSHRNKGYPKIVFVATHKDLIIADQLDDKKKVIMDSITSCITDDNIKSHLVLNELFFVNAQDKSDPEIDRLRDFLSTLITENPQWGNKVPKQFLILEMMLASLVEDGRDVMSHVEVEKLNKQTGFEELSSEELELFLHMQYMNGKLTYLDTPELRDHVLIDPTLLIDVFKSVVTPVPSAPELKRGRLYKSSIELLWKSDRFKQLHPYKKYFLDLLVYYDILAEVKRYDIESGKKMDTDVFIVPCMITTNPEPSLIAKTLQSDKLISFVFAFRGYDVPTALPNRLMASLLAIWNAKEYENKELMFPGFLAVTVDRKHDLAIRVEQNLIAVYLIHKLKKELIIRDIASSVRECLEENLMRISEAYSFTFNEEMKPQRSVPFDLKLRSRCCLHDTIDVLTIGSTYKCTNHGQNTPISELNIWYTDRTSTECPMHCQGIPEAILPNLLNETQLLRLCNSLLREEVRHLALHLGIKPQTLDEVEEEQNTSAMIKFYSLRVCRDKNKRCKDFLNSMQSVGIDIHTMCKILRQEEVKTELPDKILTATPSDEMFDKLCIWIGNEWMVLGLELGLEIERLEEIEYENPRNRRKTSRRMLSVWRNREEVATIRDLVHAFGRAGRNPDLITESLKNCSSFPRIEAAD